MKYEDFEIVCTGDNEAEVYYKNRKWGVTVFEDIEDIINKIDYFCREIVAEEKLETAKRLNFDWFDDFSDFLRGWGTEEEILNYSNEEGF